MSTGVTDHAASGNESMAFNIDDSAINEWKDYSKYESIL